MSDRLRLVQTCGGCPEQYDVFDSDGNYVAYFRLRHGQFTAEVTLPGQRQKGVYWAEPSGDGVFESGERVKFLNAACRAVIEYMEQGWACHDEGPIYDLIERE